MVRNQRPRRLTILVRHRPWVRRLDDDIVVSTRRIDRKGNRLRHPSQLSLVPRVELTVCNNVLDFAYNNLICRNITESSHLESLKVKPKYLASLVNLRASSPIKTVGINRL